MTGWTGAWMNAFAGSLGRTSLVPRGARTALAGFLTRHPQPPLEAPMPRGGRRSDRAPVMSPGIRARHARRIRAMRTRGWGPAPVVCVLVLWACGDVRPPPVPSFAVTFLAESDPGLPLAGVTVLANDAPQGESGAEGIVQTSLEGRTGASVTITYRCPEGYRAERESQTLRLHRFQGAADASSNVGLQMRLTCVPLTRGVAFVVRTNGWANLPVMLNGREVTRTNAQGIAHIVLRSPPGPSFQVKLSTESLPTLRPRNPVMTFPIGSADEVFVFNQEFNEESQPRNRRRRSPPPPDIPRPSIMRITRIP